MNWTGGSLTRSKNAKSSVIATQKKHFAKAREKLYHGPQPPLSLDFSIFEPLATVTKKPCTQQTSLFGPRDDSEYPQERFKRCGTRKSVATGGESLMSPRNALKIEAVTPSESGRSNRHGSSESPTRLPGYSSRNRNLGKDDMATSAEIEFEAKKKELLAMRDWCGLESSRPVRMTFEDQADREMIGRRRRVDKVAPREKRRDHHRFLKSRRRSSQSTHGSQTHPTRGVETHSPIIKSDLLSKAGRGGNFADALRRPCSASNSDEMLLGSTPSTYSVYFHEGKSTGLERTAKRANSNMYSDEMLLDCESTACKKHHPCIWDVNTPTKQRSSSSVQLESQEPSIEHGLTELDISPRDQASVISTLEEDHIPRESDLEAKIKQELVRQETSPVQEESLALEEHQESWLEPIFVDKILVEHSTDKGKQNPHHFLPLTPK